MSGLASASDRSDLVEGDVWAVEALSGGVEALGVVLGWAAESVRSVDTTGWCGRASAAADDRIAELLPVLERAEQAFAEVASALDEWARQLDRAQRMAGYAIEDYRYGDRLTGTWLCSGSEGEVRVRAGAGDPGVGYRVQADEQYAEAKRLVDEAASDCSRRLYAAANSGYELVPWWKAIGHHSVEVLRGFGRGIESLAEVPPALFEAGAWLLDTTPSNFDDRLGTIRRFGRRVADDPLAFTEEEIDWDTLIENPDQWIGQVVPDVLSGRVLGAGAAVHGPAVADEMAATLRLLWEDETGAISFGVRTQRINEIVRSFRNVHITVAGRRMMISGSDMRYMLSRHDPMLAITDPTTVQTFYPPGMTPQDLADVATEVFRQNWDEVAGHSPNEWLTLRAEINGIVWEAGVRDTGHVRHLVPLESGS